ncbi:MAG: hypothetical protein IH626_07315 [Rhodospirillales bacterium]|nr:hypothetical protein [Rhodospirillales bacterium]
MRHSTRLLLAALGSASLAAGCTSPYEPKPVEMTLDGPKLISNTASVKNTFVMDADSPLVVCAEPPPDAAFSQNTNLDITIALVAAGGDKGGDDDEGSEESEMAGRSPGVLLARELLFRLCEFSRNHKVDKDVAIELYKQNLDIIREVGNKEAEHTAVKIGDAVTNAETITVDERLAGGRPKRKPTANTDKNKSSSYTYPYDSSTSGSNSSSSDDDDY